MVEFTEYLSTGEKDSQEQNTHHQYLPQKNESLPFKWVLELRSYYELVEERKRFWKLKSQKSKQKQ